jgi:hypothetical protein
LRILGHLLSALHHDSFLIVSIESGSPFTIDLVHLSSDGDTMRALSDASWWFQLNSWNMSPDQSSGKYYRLIKAPYLVIGIDGPFTSHLIGETALNRMSISESPSSSRLISSSFMYGKKSSSQWSCLEVNCQL